MMLKSSFPYSSLVLPCICEKQAQHGVVQTRHNLIRLKDDQDPSHRHSHGRSCHRDEGRKPWKTPMENNFLVLFVPSPSGNFFGFIFQQCLGTVGACSKLGQLQSPDQPQLRTHKNVSYLNANSNLLNSCFGTPKATCLYSCAVVHKILKLFSNS